MIAQSAHHQQSSVITHDSSQSSHTFVKSRKSSYTKNQKYWHDSEKPEI